MVVRLLFPLVVHADVHVHLADVLMRDLFRLQVNQDEALQDVVVEHQVDEVVFFLGVDALLSGDECVPLAELHEELLQVVDNALLEVRLQIRRVLLHAKKLGDDRALDELELFLVLRRQLLHLTFDGILTLRLQHPVVVLRRDVALQGTGAPVLSCRLLRVPLPRLLVVHLEKRPIMRPRQKRRGRFSTQ